MEQRRRVLERGRRQALEPRPQLRDAPLLREEFAELLAAPRAVAGELQVLLPPLGRLARPAAAQRGRRSRRRRTRRGRVDSEVDERLQATLDFGVDALALNGNPPQVVVERVSPRRGAVHAAARAERLQPSRLRPLQSSPASSRGRAVGHGRRCERANQAYPKRPEGLRASERARCEPPPARHNAKCEKPVVAHVPYKRTHNAPSAPVRTPFR
eukprot:4804213-Prymnesium_polylepis.1